MNRITKGLLAITLAGTISFTPAVSAANPSEITTVFAHSGRTDAQGGHHDNQNASGLGSYHYHCGGHPAHLHENGVCPYAKSVSNSSTSSKSSSGSSSSVSKSTIKKVQKKLNKLGYNCGTADGIMGSKTKKALKKFQKDNGLKADGIIGKKTLKALGFS